MKDKIEITDQNIEYLEKCHEDKIEPDTVTLLKIKLSHAEEMLHTMIKIFGMPQAFHEMLIPADTQDWWENYKVEKLGLPPTPSAAGMTCRSKANER